MLAPHTHSIFLSPAPPFLAGNLLFHLVGHQDVVRDLSFAPGNPSSILVSASRDKTLRVWDLGQNGKPQLVGPASWTLLGEGPKSKFPIWFFNPPPPTHPFPFLFFIFFFFVVSETIESAFWTFAVGLQLLHFSRRSNALLRGWREIGELSLHGKGCVV